MQLIKVNGLHTQNIQNLIKHPESSHRFFALYLAALEKYGLLFYFHPNDIQDSFEKLHELIHNPLKEHFMQCRQQLLSESVDITALLIRFIRDYPRSDALSSGVS